MNAQFECIWGSIVTKSSIHECFLSFYWLSANFLNRFNDSNESILVWPRKHQTQHIVVECNTLNRNTTHLTPYKRKRRQKPDKSPGDICQLRHHCHQQLANIQCHQLKVEDHGGVSDSAGTSFKHSKGQPKPSECPTALRLKLMALTNAPGTIVSLPAFSDWKAGYNPHPLQWQLPIANEIEPCSRLPEPDKYPRGFCQTTVGKPEAPICCQDPILSFSTALRKTSRQANRDTGAGAYRR